MASSPRNRLLWLMGAGCGLALALGAANPAEAITYNFENVTIAGVVIPAGATDNGTGTIVGSFEFNGTNASIQSGQSVTINYIGSTSTNSFNFTFLPASTTVAYTASGGGSRIVFQNNPVGSSNYLLMTFNRPLSTAPDTVANFSGGYYCFSGSIAANCHTNRSQFVSVSGSATSVPSPVSIVGLAPLMAMALFRKRFSKLSA
jgi:hypothetical protein